MNKPNGYEAAKASGSYTPINLGGHTCVIKRVAETKSKNGDDMIVVLFDFDREDAQAGYFQREFEGNTKQDKKWPFNGTCWIMVNDYQDKSQTSSKFKGFIENVMESNNYKVQWGGDNWGQQFVGKRIGAVYGNEEDEYNGEYRMRPRMKWFTSTERARTAKVPEAKYIKNKPAAQAKPQNDQFTETNDEEIPF